MEKPESSSDHDGWGKMSIRKKMKEKIDDFIETEVAKDYGLTNSTQFLDVAVREALEKYKKKRFEHFNFADNIIRLIDNDQPKGTPYIEIVLNNNHLICRVCESKNCIHIAEAWNNKQIAKQMKRKGLKNIL